MEKINGTPVTEELLEQIAAEAEQGYDVAQLRKRGRKPMGTSPARVVPVRIEDDLLNAVDAFAEHEHLSRSSVIRAAIRAYVA